MALFQNTKKYSAAEDINKKEIYIKKIGKRGKIDVWVVDGKKIRDKINAEFTNFGQHFRFPFVPEYEFWLDREAVSNERNFFIDNLLCEWKLMKNGENYFNASEFGNHKEQSERKKAGDLKKVLDKNGKISVDKIHSRLLGKSKEKISVWLVYGRLARSAFDVEFTEGGHDLAYNYIPKNEVWIDDDVLGAERPYVLLHELYERSLMEEENLSYAKAHDRASELEWQARHDKKVLDENLAALKWNPS